MCEDQLSQVQAQKSGPVDMEISALSPATTPGGSEAFGLENLAQEKPQSQIPSFLHSLFMVCGFLLLLLFCCYCCFFLLAVLSSLRSWLHPLLVTGLQVRTMLGALAALEVAVPIPARRKVVPSCSRGQI